MFSLLTASFAMGASAAIQCKPDQCLVPKTFSCKDISPLDCTEDCHWSDPTNPDFCSDNHYTKVANTATSGGSIQCNSGSTRLEYSSLDDCADMCDSCIGCVGYVDNRESSQPYCVFKESENLSTKSSKDYYRGSFTMLPNTAIKANSQKCDGSTRLSYQALHECTAKCNACDGCVGYVDNRESPQPYCVFKNSESGIYEKSSKNYYRQDTSFLKRFPMDSLGLALKEHFDQLMAENPDEEQLRFEDVLEDSYALIRGEKVIDFDFTEEEEDLFTAVMRGTDTESQECTDAIVKVGIDAVGVFLQLIGLGARSGRIVAAAAFAGLTTEEITGFMLLLDTIGSGESLFDDAMDLLGIVSHLMRITGTSALLKAARATVQWYDWAIMSITIVAQIAALELAGPFAFAAELTMFSAALLQEGIDAAIAVDVCENSK